jgi:hypothetical protein
LQKVFGKTEIHLTVERLNLHAPMQFRSLCQAVFISPVDFNLFAGDEYQLLCEHD